MMAIIDVTAIDSIGPTRAANKGMVKNAAPKPV